MNRDEKIKVLKSLSAGKLMLGALLPAKFLTFIKSDDKPGVVEFEGKQITEAAAQQIAQQAMTHQNGRVHWIEFKNYSG